MAAEKKHRIVYYDILRAIACLCILTIHFNASFSGFNGESFLYPNAVISYNLFNNNIYMGSFGVSLFFILSGASMHRAYGNREFSLPQFYKKRFLSLFPMFWIAWFAAMAVSDLVYGGVPSGGLGAALSTLLGMDGYLLVYGQGALSVFYQVGEWYMGCIILIYLVVPFLLWGVKKFPVLTGAVSLLIFVLLCNRVTDKFFILRLPEVVFGMLFDRYFHAQKGWWRGIWTAGLILGIILLSMFGSKFLPEYAVVLCVLVSAMFFSTFALVFQDVQDNRLVRPISWLAKYSYPIFLVHHQVCEYMSRRFYLPELPKRTLLFSFVVYLVIAVLLAVLLDRVTRRVTNFSPAFYKFVQKAEHPLENAGLK